MGAATTSWQVYLSRGVAGTTSQPILPVLEIESFLATKLFESPSIRQSSLRPAHPLIGQMPAAPALTVDPSQCTHKKVKGVNRQPKLHQNNQTDKTTTKRSERLRHVFPRPSRRSVHHGGGSSQRVSKTDQYKSAFLYRRQLKPRGTFQRVINSFFGHQLERGARSISPQGRSRTSSAESRLGLSIQDSVPSLDLLYPGTFLFSGPHLQSAGSYNSAPRLPDVTGSFDQTYATGHRHSDSFSMIDIAGVEADLLEPIVNRGVVRSMSNVLLGINKPFEELEDSLLESPDEEADSHLSRETRIRCSSAADVLCRNPLITTLILRHTDTTTWRILRSSCRLWRDVIDHLAPLPVRPASGRLPTEILLSIFSYLGAKDFNACRRTCRRWTMASLDESLLRAMLCRGGWCGGILLAKDDGRAQRCQRAPNSQAWTLSQNLSRQCALASRWTGNGLDDRPAIVESTTIDFSELAARYLLHRRRNSGTLVFTSSVCGNYLLVAKENLIYVYHLEDGRVEPVSCVICPRRVFAMTMSASMGRNAVAALLEGRMGMVCELQHGQRSMKLDDGQPHVEGYGNPPQQKGWPTTDSQEAIASAEYTAPRVFRSFPYVQDTAQGSFDAIELKAHNQGISLQETDNPRSHDRNLINQTWNLSLRGSLNNIGTDSKVNPMAQEVPVERGTSTFYRHLCSEDDPPRNVSICPQRRCVAFGCSAGIELHWVDAFTGSSLSRWFPLTSPSDHLYFLSPRPGFESAKKLRLISSAAHPDGQPADGRKSFSSATISSFSGSSGFVPSARQWQRSDHYHAIPLSDGLHVLFVDPSTDRLTLGCDEPPGGPTRLLRKVVLLPPEGQGVARIYTAAADMSSGTRIVAVFEDIIVLYSVPSDVLALSALEQTAESSDVYKTAPFSSTGRQHNHWLNWWEEEESTPRLMDRSEAGDENSIWPVMLSGTEIGRLADVCELIVQTRPDIVIWAFTYASQCKTWRLHNYVDPVVRTKQCVDKRGVVHDSYKTDESRDVIMQDGPSFASFHVDERSIGPQFGEGDGAKQTGVMAFEGKNASAALKKIPRALAVENDSWVDTIDVAGCADAWFEGDGDVVTRPVR